MLYSTGWLSGGAEIDRERLFVATLGVSLVMTAVFAGALVYDVAGSRDGGGSVVSVSTPLPEATATEGGDAAGGAAPGTPVPAAPGIGPVGGRSGGGTGTLPRPAVRAPAAAGVLPAGSTIVIGALITQSGPLDASDAYHAEEAWVQSVNAQGGIDGHRLSLDVRDDQGNPAVGRPALEQIVQEDHALALVGECGPVTDATVVDEIGQLQVPVVNDCLTSAAGYRSPFIWFSVPAPDAWQAVSARYIYKHQDQMRMHHPYVLCVNSSVTKPYCDGFVNEWARLGGKTCSAGACNGGYDEEQIGTTRAQYEAQAVRIRSSGADSIVAELEPSNQAALMQALQDQGMSPQTWPEYAPLGMDPNSIRTVGAFADGIYVDTGDSYFPTEATPAIRQLAQALQRYSPGTPVDQYSLSIGWTPCVLFGEALRRLGANVSRQSLAAALDAMGGFDSGLTRPLQWSAPDHSAPPYTRWATVQGPAAYQVFTGWIDGNGDPAP